MKDFTTEEKELIVNTPIIMDCFEKWEDYSYEEIVVNNFEHPLEKMRKCIVHLYPTACYESLIKNCEVIRRKYLETKNDHYFDILLKMLPASYKVVNLC